MVNQDILVQLNKIIGENLAENNFELVEFTHRYEGRDLVLRLFVDKPEGGITMDECASLNRSLGQLLDEKDIIPVRYILEVSSSGLDRPLMSRKDFMRCLNKQAVFFLNQPVNGKLQVQGRITSAGDTSVFIDDSGQVLEIPLTKINKAKLII
ncbi:MAG: ribosome maturation factor RimP [Candidatus Omnitrophota bacterium]